MFLIFRQFWHVYILFVENPFTEIILCWSFLDSFQVSEPFTGTINLVVWCYIFWIWSCLLRLLTTGRNSVRVQPICPNPLYLRSPYSSSLLKIVYFPEWDALLNGTSLNFKPLFIVSRYQLLGRFVKLTFNLFSSSSFFTVYLTLWPHSWSSANKKKYV